MKNIVFIIICVLTTTISKAQDLNSYKYIIVPEEFEFLKEPDQYQLNSLTKFLLEKHGFEAYKRGEELPADFSSNPCEALVAEVENNSGLFRTKVNLVLKDCYNKQIFISEEGTSRKKDFKEAYHEALRDAFRSLEDLNYKYNEAIVTARPEMVPETQNQYTIREEPTKSEKAPVSEGSTEEEFNPERSNFASEGTYSRNNSIYNLKKTAKGYNMFQDGMEEPFAALVKPASGNNYIYSAINSQGMAHFDNEGNLVIEILNSETGEVASTIYKLQN